MEISVEGNGKKMSEFTRVIKKIGVGVLSLALLIAAYYLVENWQGKRAWENYKNKLEAKGEHLDLDFYVPPPVTDDQNAFEVQPLRRWLYYESLDGQGPPGLIKP